MRRLSPEELAARRERLRADLARRMADARSQRTGSPRLAELQAARRRRRAWRLLVVAVLVGVLVMLCSGVLRCDPPPAAPLTPVPPADEAVAGPEEAGAGGAGVPRLAPRPRPRFPALEPPEVPWLEAFRLQVAARGPRLAACFVGADHPGTLRWTAAVEPLSGRVSRAEVVPLLDSAALSRAQEACVLGVLADPVYRLEGGGDQGAPTKLSIVLEF